MPHLLNLFEEGTYLKKQAIEVFWKDLDLIGLDNRFTDLAKNIFFLLKKCMEVLSILAHPSFKSLQKFTFLTIVALLDNLRFDYVKYKFSFLGEKTMDEFENLYFTLDESFFYYEEAKNQESLEKNKQEMLKTNLKLNKNEKIYEIKPVKEVNDNKNETLKSKYEQKENEIVENVPKTLVKKESENKKEEIIENKIEESNKEIEKLPMVEEIKENDNNQDNSKKSQITTENDNIKIDQKVDTEKEVIKKIADQKIIDENEVKKENTLLRKIENLKRNENDENLEQKWERIVCRSSPDKYSFKYLEKLSIDFDFVDSDNEKKSDFSTVFEYLGVFYPFYHNLNSNEIKKIQTTLEKTRNIDELCRYRRKLLDSKIQILQKFYEKSKVGIVELYEVEKELKEQKQNEKNELLKIIQILQDENINDYESFVKRTKENVNKNISFNQLILNNPFFKQKTYIPGCIYV